MGYIVPFEDAVHIYVHTNAVYRKMKWTCSEDLFVHFHRKPAHNF